jgi:hypothetical protein
MKKSILFTATLALVLGFATQCKEGGSDGPENKELAAPTGLESSDVTDVSATLGWDAVETATGYNVRINDGESVPVTQTTYRAEGLSPEMNYTWAVQAVKGEETGPWSENGTFKTDFAPISTPEGLASADVSFKTATLSWSEVTGATGYELRLNEEEETIPVTEATHTLTNLAVNTDYTWSVRATIGERQGEWSEEATFKTEFIEPIRFVNYNVQFRGFQYGDNTSNFVIGMDALPTPPVTGQAIALDLITEAADTSPLLEFISLPTGEYPFLMDATGTANTVKCQPNGGFTYFMNFTNYVPTPFYVEEGTLYISEDSGEYHIEVIGKFAGIEETLYIVYDGPFEIPNPEYLPE